MVDQLSVYNGALRECKSRKLASLTEIREARFLLDDVWGDGGITNGGVKYCLEQGYWTFASRRTLVGFDPNYDWSFGYRFRFSFPTDWIKTMGVYQDEFGNVPLTAYREENGFIYSDLDTILLDYVSNDIAYGLNVAVWPESFVYMMELYFAKRIVAKLTKSEALTKDIEEKYERAARDARSKTAMEQPTKFFPQGSFVRARTGSWPGYGRSRSNGG